MELRQLRHALALAEHRNFARAAEALNLTQSALSRSIQGLEASLGARLFDRGNRNVEPTLFGRLLLEHARRLDLGARDLSREIGLAKGLELGDLCIGAGLYGGAMLVGAAVGRLSQRHPKLRTNVVVGPLQELPDRLRAREIDLMLVQLDARGDPPEFEWQDLEPHPRFIVTRPGHPLTKLAAPRLRDALRHPLVGTRPLDEHLEDLIPQIPDELREALLRHDAFTATCASTPVLKSIVRHSDAVSAFCPFMVADELHAGTLILLPGIEIGQPIRFGVAWLRGRSLSPPARVFVDLLTEHDRELVELESSLLASLRRQVQL